MGSLKRCWEGDVGGDKGLEGPDSVICYGEKFRGWIWLLVIWDISWISCARNAEGLIQNDDWIFKLRSRWCFARLVALMVVIVVVVGHFASHHLYWLHVDSDFNLSLVIGYESLASIERPSLPAANPLPSSPSTPYIHLDKQIYCFLSNY